VPVDAARLADGLLAAGRFLIGAELSSEKRGTTRIVLKTADKTSRVAILPEAHHRSLGSALTKLTALAKEESVIALRERARALPPTWKDTLVKRQALLATGRARWLDVDTDDCANLLALDELLQAARSGDVTNAQGLPLDEATVIAWVKATLHVPSWNLLSDLLNTDATDDDEAQDVVSPSKESVPSQRSLMTLRRLRIASVDRLVREVTRVDSSATRASVLAELESAGNRVAWFGRAIVCVRDAS
jgi:hypothetical protein